MIQWLHRGSRGPRAALSAAWGALLLLVTLAMSLPAQPADNNVHLILSMKPITEKDLDNRDPDLRKGAWFLRPNVEQELYTYLLVDDPSKKPTVIVQFKAGGVEISSPPIKVEAKLTQVLWPRPEEAAKDAPKIPQQWMKPIEIRLKVDNKLSSEVIKLDIRRPVTYLDCTSQKAATDTNRLVFEVGAKKRTGKSYDDAQIVAAELPCPVELVLDPDRIPGLASANRKGVWRGNVTPVNREENDSLYLSADDVRLRSSRVPGVVTLSADGFDRAFRYRLLSSGEALQINALTQETILRINAPSVADPSKPVPMTVEADSVSAPENKTLILDALTLAKGGEKHYNRLAEFSGDRDIRWSCAGGGRHGGLLLKPDVKDWSSKRDLSGFEGKVTLRLRLLDKKTNEVVKVVDPDKEDWSNTVNEVTKTIVLDTTPPEIISFEPVPPGAVRGKPFVVRAKGLDAESGLRDVVFFLGKLPPSADLPKDLIVVHGERRQGKEDESSTWTAQLTAFSDVRNPLEVSVRFTNNVGLSTTRSISLEVANPPPPPPGGVAVKRASIAGVVMEGDRPQKGLVVELQDAAGKTLLTKETAADGTFLFPDLLPGGYRVASAKPASKTRGVAGDPKPITVAAGEAKKGVVVKLWRE